MDLSEVQAAQAIYDAEYWQFKPGLETIRHQLLHIGKLLGKLSAYCEAMEEGHEASTHVIKTEVVPDLVIYAVRLANTLAMDLNTALPDRTEQLRHRSE